ncbi:MAG: penicillin acylase family protein, partial [Myxococcota bacterium]
MWLWLAACRKDDLPPPPPADTPSPLLGVEQTAGWTVPELHGEAYVIRAEGNIPYVYAQDREDLALVSAFVVARDRFLVMDLERRLALGTVAELLGDAGLATDLESRAVGMSRVADRVLATFEADPELAAWIDAYVAGINLYVAEVAAHRLPPPSEYVQLGPALGYPDPADMLGPWGRRDVAGVAATLIYNLGFETTDVGRAEAYELAPTLFAGAADEALRRAGVAEDILPAVEPVFPTSSAPGWGAGGARSARAVGQGRALRVPASSYARLRGHLDRLEQRLGHDHDSGFGSNAWAVSGAASTDGRALLAGDGHLGLSAPPLFFRIGLDTAHLGDGDVHQVGQVLPGFFTLGVGTNGDVAWSQTQLFGDITDWYREELQLDPQGLPAAARFAGAWVPLARIDEAYVVADVPLLGSIGRTETWPRWETADGRMLTEIEGVTVDAAAPGVVNLSGTLVLPGDVDGDGVITAISFDYTGLDGGNLMRASDGFGRSRDVGEFREHTRKLVAYSQNLVAADRNGDILYTGYQAVPCRGYLPRDPGGWYVDGADPMRLIDGTTYGGFTIPLAPNGEVDEAAGADPYRCVVPFDAYPQVTSPPEGFVLTANNDPGNITTDGSMADDPHYIGGPWLEGYRAARIEQRLEEAIAAGEADADEMAAIQADHHSTTAEQMLPWALGSLEAARAAAAGSPEPGSSAERLAASWTANQARFEDVQARLLAWQAAGLPARSGVETFYDPVLPGDLDHAVATMVWAAWIGEFVNRVFEDEGFPSVWYPTGDTGRTRTLTRMIATRGVGGMASYDPARGESVFFDTLGTPEVETSDELMVASLATALDRLSGPPSGPGTGGFGTDDPAQWLWGYRHLVVFESILGELFGEDDAFGFLVDAFSITPDVLPLAPDLAPTDPRASLPGFPRHGDHLNVDAGNPGFARDEFMYGDGPVFRLVVALGPDGAPHAGPLVQQGD